VRLHIVVTLICKLIYCLSIALSSSKGSNSKDKGNFCRLCLLLAAPEYDRFLVGFEYRPRFVQRTVNNLKKLRSLAPPSSEMEMHVGHGYDELVSNEEEEANDEPNLNFEELAGKRLNQSDEELDE
jgi:hypothetical protein